MTGPFISMVQNALRTETHDVSAEAIINAIRRGNWMLRVQNIRRVFNDTLKKTGERQGARKAVDSDKKRLPAVMFSGRFSRRANDALVQHSGLLVADLDELGEKLPDVRTRFLKSPYLWALFLSPSGDGLKAVFRVPVDASKHPDSFRAIEKHVRQLTGIQIDEAGKDPARLCFMSYDPGLYHNENATEIEPLPPKPKQKHTVTPSVLLSERQRIATQELDKHNIAIAWDSDTHGFLDCPGKHLHTTGDGDRDCEIHLDRAPTIHCFHNHCHGILEAINRELRSRIGKAECVNPETQKVDLQSPGDFQRVELPPVPTPYTPPPLALLPSQLKEYVHAAAEALNVDVSFILLPLLSSLGTAIGNSRSVILKQGFVQPPNIWSAIIGRSGARKSPALETGCFAVTAHERGLIEQNKQAREQYEDRLADWQSKKPKDRGLKPQPPSILTCAADDLTIEVLSDLLIANPRGVLTRKDELAHLFGSFDQYKSHAKGSDISRWLSLHTGVFLATDRRSDNRHHRIWQPRVCITGGIQPKVLRRILSEDFFERGLPARFLVVNPPFRQDRWSEATVPDDIKNAALNLFEELWLLQPEKDDSGNLRPSLLQLAADAKAEFVAFYDECGTAALEADEHGEAAYCKLTAYAARFALVGQVARDPNAEVVTAETMRAACELARSCGKEAVRIYAELAETREQRELRELIEFVERRDGAATVRDTITYYWPLKNKPERAQQIYDRLVLSGRGKWEDRQPSGPGRPTRVFRLLPTSASAKIHELRGETANCADAEATSSQKITPLAERNAQAFPGELDAMPTGLSEL